MILYPDVRAGTFGPISLNDEGDLVFAWADPFGGFLAPGSTEAELATVTFNIAEGASGLTELELVKTSTPPGYAFDGQAQEIAVVASSGDSSGSSDSAESVITVPELQADTQHVYVSESTKSEDGTQVTVKLSYSG